MGWLKIENIENSQSKWKRVYIYSSSGHFLTLQCSLLPAKVFFFFLQSKSYFPMWLVYWLQFCLPKYNIRLNTHHYLPSSSFSKILELIVHIVLGLFSIDTLLFKISLLNPCKQYKSRINSSPQNISANICEQHFKTLKTPITNQIENPSVTRITHPTLERAA